MEWQPAEEPLNVPWISMEQLERARRKLAKGKAKGLDELQDIYLKSEEIWDKAKDKILIEFNRSLRQGSVPLYFKRSRIIPLSKDKDNSQFPKVGEVRTISVTPCIAKLFELIVLELLQAEVDIKCPIFEKQRGFCQGKSTEDNLAETLHQISLDKLQEKEYRRLKVKNKDRPKSFYIFIDLKKAFDRVVRSKLLDKL